MQAMSSVFSLSGKNEGGGESDGEKSPPLLPDNNNTADSDSSSFAADRASSILRSVQGALSLGIEPAQAASSRQEISGRTKEKEEETSLPSESVAVDDDGVQRKGGGDGQRMRTALGSGLGFLNRRKDDDLNVDDSNREGGDGGENGIGVAMQGREKSKSAVGLTHGDTQERVGRGGGGGSGSAVGGRVEALAGYVTEQVSRINTDSAKVRHRRKDANVSPNRVIAMEKQHQPESHRCPFSHGIDPSSPLRLLSLTARFDRF